MRAPEFTTIGTFSPRKSCQAYSQAALVGEIMYDSIVTEREEPLPVGVSVIGAPGTGFRIIITTIAIDTKLTVDIAGTDLYLADLVEKGMKARRIPTKLKTGRSIY